jgi:pfkB family carbohydrate kinase
MNLTERLHGLYEVTARPHVRVPQPLPDTEEVRDYIKRAQRREFLGHITKAFERADEMSIAFIGERIVDEYRYVTALGNSSKEFTLAVVEGDSEVFQGGVYAASRHGEWPNATTFPSDSYSSDEIRKTRYVDADFNRKLFEVYSNTAIWIGHEDRRALVGHLQDIVQKFDVVIVFDFGHGMLTTNERLILEKAKFLAVNAQTNAGNRGYNLITSYKKADLICIDDPEARLATGMRDDPVEWVLNELCGRINCPNIAITHGRQGSMVAERAGGAYHVPALSSQPVDTIGAGDAFLTVTAPLVAAGLDLEMAAFVGNIAGAIKVGIIGHRAHVTRAAIKTELERLLVPRCGMLK